jgi:hypothetical protein
MSSVGRSSDGYLRKYKSGSEKRKQNKIQQQRLEKMKGSIIKFMATEHVAVDDAHDQSSNSIQDDSPQVHPTVTKEHDGTLQIATSESEIDTILASTSFKYDRDPANWVVNSNLMEYLLEHPPDENSNCEMKASARIFGNKTTVTRYAQKDYFHRTL